LISIRDLRFRYGDGGFALAVRALDVRQGERVALIGPSGSGKTTLLHLTAGIRTADAGRIETAGVDVTALDDSSRREFRIRTIGLVFQEFELLQYLDVRDNILLPYLIHSTLRLTGAARARAAELAESVGIGDKLGRRPSQLSQGERQRVAVCRALIAEPRVLLADEPTGNLDPSNKGRVLDILLEHAERRGASVLTVTHDHDLLGRFERTIDFRDFHSSSDVKA